MIEAQARDLLALEGFMRKSRSGQVLGAGSGEDHDDSTHDDLEIQPDAPIVDISHIQ